MCIIIEVLLCEGGGVIFSMFIIEIGLFLDRSKLCNLQVNIVKMKEVQKIRNENDEIHNVIEQTKENQNNLNENQSQKSIWKNIIIGTCPISASHLPSSSSH